MHFIVDLVQNVGLCQWTVHSCVPTFDAIHAHLYDKLERHVPMADQIAEYGLCFIAELGIRLQQAAYGTIVQLGRAVLQALVRIHVVEGNVAKEAVVEHAHLAAFVFLIDLFDHATIAWLI